MGRQKNDAAERNTQSHAARRIQTEYIDRERQRCKINLWSRGRKNERDAKENRNIEKARYIYTWRGKIITQQREIRSHAGRKIKTEYVDRETEV